MPSSSPRPETPRPPMATWLHSSTVTSPGFTRRLLVWPVTPNQITVVSTIVRLAGALGLATVSYTVRLAGILALLALSVPDGMDGELARARREQSSLGVRLDLAGDYAVNLAAFLGLGIGLGRQGLPPHGLWAAQNVSRPRTAASQTARGAMRRLPSRTRPQINP